MLVLVLAGCAKAPDLAGIGGSFDVLGPDGNFAAKLGSGAAPAYWHLEGAPSEGSLSVSEISRVPALGIRPGPADYWFVREVNASLLATPFLSWSWYSEPPVSGAHPVRLVVGFATATSSRSAPWWAVISSDLPRASQIVAIEWSQTALDRGSVIGPKIRDDDRSYGRYIARGGAEYASRWWTDSVDLSLLYRQLWPGRVIRDAEIRFIGVWSMSSRDSASMYLANVRLFR